MAVTLPALALVVEQTPGLFGRPRGGVEQVGRGQWIVAPERLLVAAPRRRSCRPRAALHPINLLVGEEIDQVLDGDERRHAAFAFGCPNSSGMSRAWLVRRGQNPKRSPLGAAR